MRRSEQAIGELSVVDEDDGVCAADDFQMVRKRRRRKVIIGSNRDSGHVAAIPRQGYLHVYRMKPGTSAEDILDYLGKTAPDIKFGCELLKDNGKSSSFKVNFPLEKVAGIYEPAIWPSGAAVRRFIFPKRPGHDAPLNFPQRTPVQV